jgi:hypothetical protein
MARQPLSPSEARREREMQRELRRFHREHDCGDADAPTATQLAKKRLRVPAVDVDTNPFCMERQLADEYERMNLNKVRPRVLRALHMFPPPNSDDVAVAVSRTLGSTPSRSTSRRSSVRTRATTRACVRLPPSLSRSVLVPDI